MPKTETRRIRSRKSAVEQTAATKGAATKAPLTSERVSPSVRRTISQQSNRIRTKLYLTPIEAFRTAVPDLVAILREGVPARNVVLVSDAMHVEQRDVMNFLRLPTSTIRKKIKDRQNLTPEQSERLIGLQRLIGQVEVMVQESGDASDFDAGRWFAQWIQRPLGALGGAKPQYYLDTMSGQYLVSQLLAQMQSGAYA